jgi:hypothetical protein
VRPTHASKPATAGDGSTIPRDSLLAVIDDNVDGMLVIDQGGIIRLANRAACALERSQARCASE